MKDMMMEVYNALCENETIKTEVGKSQIKFYETVESLDHDKPFIVVDALGPPESALFGSDKELSQSFSYQINVETKKRMLTKEIQKAIKDTLMDKGFFQLRGGVDEYFPETKRFVDARRYKKNTTIYDTDY